MPSPAPATTRTRASLAELPYLVDYGAVRDFGQSDPATRFVGANNGPLVQIPGTGTIWKICR